MKSLENETIHKTIERIKANTIINFIEGMDSILNTISKNDKIITKKDTINAVIYSMVSVSNHISDNANKLTRSEEVHKLVSKMIPR